jgi:hypothetical protein
VPTRSPFERGGETLRNREQGREGKQREPHRDEHRPAELLVGEELLEQVVGRLDVAGLSDDHAVDGVHRQAALDDREEPLVVGAPDDHHRRIRVVCVDEFVELAGDGAVAADRLRAGQHRDDGILL